MKRVYQSLNVISGKSKGLLLLLLISFNIPALMAESIQVDFETSGGTLEVCQGTTFAITAYAAGGTGEYIDYHWESMPGMLFTTGFPDIVVFNTSYLALPGTYQISLTITDSGNNTGTGYIEITLKETTRVNIFTDDPTSFCHGDSALLQAEPLTGSSYQWRKNLVNIPGADLPEYAATETGSYRVRMTSENGCASTSPEITITVNELPIVSATNNGPDCIGSDIQLFSTPDGAESYLWSSQADASFTSALQNPVITGISLEQAGNYTVTVTDANGCSNSATTEIILEAPAVAPELVEADITEICQGETGDITLTATGGSGQVLYWFEGGCQQTPVGQGSTLTIPYPATTTTYFASWDSGSCGFSDCKSVTVTVNDAPSVLVEVTDVSCFGEQNGSAYVVLTADLEPYTVLWNNGSQDTLIENLTAGIYSALVTGSNGCSTQVQAEVKQPELLTVSLIEQTNVSCNGLSDGQATLKANGGTPPYSYQWDDGQSGPTATALAAGSYMVEVTDKNGCTQWHEVVITEPAPVIIDVLSITHNLCFNENNGSVTVGVTNGTAPFTYTWDNGQTGETATGLSAGSYQVTVTDANNCMAVREITITEPPELIPVVTAKTDLFCFGDSTASATVEVTGGTPDYSYLWSDGQTTGTADNLPSGIHTVLVTDANGCTAQTSVEITGPEEMIITFDETQSISCFEGSDGGIQAIVSGGTPEYSYLWNTSQTTSSISNLSAGAYLVEVSDNNGCTTRASYNLSQPSALEVIVTDNQSVSCSGGSDGQVTVTGNGGTAPYTYLWDNGQAGPTADNLAAGLYQVTVTDSNGCYTIKDVEVTSPDSVYIEVVSLVDESCFGLADGSVQVEAFGGTPGYSYQWDTGESGKILNGLAPGTYSVTATDMNGCWASIDVVVSGPAAALEVEIVSENILCAGESTGSAMAIVSGGTPFEGDNPYSYFWTNGSTTAQITGLSAGIYDLQVIDANGCTVSGSVEITEPAVALYAFAGDDATVCHPDNQGFIALGGSAEITPTASGGTPPYSYSWSSLPADESLQAQEAMENPVVSPYQNTVYTLTVTDNAGCVKTDEITVSVEPEIIAEAGGDNEGNIFLCRGGSVTLGGNPTGTGNTAYLASNQQLNSGQFEYLWEQVLGDQLIPVSTEEHPEVSPDMDATYVVTVNDSANRSCVAVDTVNVLVSEPLAVTIPADAATCPEDNPGEGFLLASYVTGGTGNYLYTWSSSPHDISLEGQENISSPVVRPSVTTTYTLLAEDSQGVAFSAMAQTTITLFPEVFADAGADTIICHPQNQGSIVLGGSPSAWGGSGVFTYYWTATPEDSSLNGGHEQANPVVSPEVTTTYKLVVTDDNGCQKESEITVYVNSLLTASAGEDTGICNPANGGSVQLGGSAQGGMEPYTWSWSPEAGLSDASIADPIATPETTSVYTLTVTDLFGCQASSEVTITPSDALVTDAGEDQLICNPLNAGSAIISAEVSGGSGNYSFLWWSFPEDSSLQGQENQQSIVVTPQENTEYFVQVNDLEGAGCLATDSVNVALADELIVDAGADQSVCNPENGPGVQLQAVAGGGSGIVSSWEWMPAEGLDDSSIANPIASPQITTTYTVQITDSNGCIATDEVVVEVFPQLFAEAGDNINSCYGIPLSLGGSPSAWGGSQTGFSYQWTPEQGLDDPTSANPLVYFPSQDQEYTLTITDSNGCVATDSILIFIAPPVTADAGTEQTVCTGSEVTLGGSPTGSGGQDPYMYFWWKDPNIPVSNQSNPSVTVNETTEYFVTVTDIYGCFSGSSVLITVDQPVEAYAGEDITVCQGESAILSASGGNDYLWSTGETTSSIEVSPLETTTYTVNVSNTCGEESDDVTVTVEEGQFVDLGEDIETCADNSVILDAGYFENAEYQWSTGSDQQTIEVTESGEYWVTVTNTNTGCFANDEIQVSFLPLPVTDAGEDKSICHGSVVIIGPEDFEPIPGNLFQWTSNPVDESISDPVALNPGVSPEVTTTYTLTQTDPVTGCQSQMSIVVEVLPLPEALVADHSSICEGESVSLGQDDEIPGYTYYWISDPAGFTSNDHNPEVIPLETTEYILTVENQQGCQASDTVVITVVPAPVPEVIDDILFCQPWEITPVQLGGESVEGYTYEWTSYPEGFTSDSSNPLAFLGNDTSVTYYLTVTTPEGCSAMDSVNLAVSDISLVSIDSPAICSDQPQLELGQFVELTGGTPPYTYEWFDPQGELVSEELNLIASAPYEDYYTFVVKDDTGCVVSTEVEILVIPMPEVELLVNPEGAAFIGQLITFTAEPAGYHNYIFRVDEQIVQEGSSNVYSTNTLETGQTVSVIVNNQGCYALLGGYTAQVADLPNAFTPDGDGINDIFGRGHNLTIFNRWGQTVHEGTKGWDGTYNGKYVSPGTYYYIMEVVDRNNQQTSLKGSVTVIRSRD